MTLFEIVAVLLTLSALFSWANEKWLRLPTTIGLMIMALGLSLLLILAGHFVPALEERATGLLERIEFDQALLHGMLGFLLFAGALHVDLDDLRQHKTVIGALATVGVVVSTFVVGGLMWLAFGAVGVPLRLVECLLFGALISPTDPIAVMAILKKLGATRSVETKIAGESLLNDGVGVVLFLVLFGLAGYAGGEPIGSAGVAWLFVVEVGGGVLLGLALGYLAFRLLLSVENYTVEIMLSLALVSGGYALADRLHLSGPIFTVVAGLLIGNQGRTLAMSEVTREHLDTFWELIDEILNAVLFVLIGLEILVLRFTGSFLGAGLLAIPIVLLARFVSVGLPFAALRRLRRRFTPHAVKILTWSGLRGGISVALALSIPRTLDGAPVAARDPLLAATYVVVVFSIIVQGLTVAPVVRRLLSGELEESKSA